MPQSKTPLNPTYGEADVYYRHAKGENLFLVGSEENPYKGPWLRKQIEMFTSLGWKFLVLDMSSTGMMGQPHIIGDGWSQIERNAIQQITSPVIIRTRNLTTLLNALDEIYVLKTEIPALKHVVVVYLGANRALSTDDRTALYEALKRLMDRKHGVWLAAERFQAFPMEHMESFHTQIVLTDDETDIEISKWAKMFHIEDLESVDVDEQEALFLFRGRSEGAQHLYVCPLTNRKEW
ncbi:MULTISPECIES: hypothetical protein [Alicyclobacillus]|uniref:Uncharacterized protein n=1 Tax=Alicyclobacillus acidoterrestris (strain ATCC 49025 / DSM 3922 / CIP 106132 / NCIMB 13137 / GD3B) TaxID=1356854 RepID=T0D8T4_ALIAG|nr:MULTISPECIES: hypothetical protein [Alicyclobacillus]EPZ47907.1 hypothetical protein N007_04930 [Alicyclobacillus acidoterrestris ATCC 49025]UNO51027.1 hypothetical protein K1I37_21415 [Alicyclobacillus acidoterrestris]GEO27770.1 hypothetical protein AAC03nite_35550 [Alicyclobacillus acidoterrestris]